MNASIKIMEQPKATTEYDLMFSSELLRRLLPTSRVILLQYYAEADILAVLADLEKQGMVLEKLGFIEALDEFEHRGITRIANLAPWLTVKKKCTNH
jgi:hypothetical protein